MLTVTGAYRQIFYAFEQKKAHFSFLGKHRVDNFPDTRILYIIVLYIIYKSMYARTYTRSVYLFSLIYE